MNSSGVISETWLILRCVEFVQNDIQEMGRVWIQMYH